MSGEGAMPALSPTLTGGTRARWVKAEGEAGRSGDAIAEIETDKATMEIEAVEEGTLARILVPEGTENVPVNQVIALLLTDGEAAKQRRSVDRYDLAQYFDCIVIEGEFGVGKPDERVFRHALAAVSGRPETTWMIGDSLEVDIAPAIGMGMHGVLVDTTGDGLPADTPARPDRIVRAISELI